MSLKLEEFLSELIERVRKDNLSSDITKSLSDLFLQNELEKAGVKIDTLLKERDIKYYTMGWYVYNSLSDKDL